MSRISFRRLVIAALLVLPFLLLPISAFAQEAAISGTVTDQTGGVLPGVVVRAVNDANGNSFEAVTDSTGKYLLTVRIGDYRVGAELAGFATVERAACRCWSASRSRSACRCRPRRCRSP